MLCRFCYSRGPTLPPPAQNLGAVLSSKLDSSFSNMYTSRRHNFQKKLHCNSLPENGTPVISFQSRTDLVNWASFFILVLWRTLYSCISNTVSISVPPAQPLLVLHFLNVRQFNLPPFHCRLPYSALFVSSTPWLFGTKGDSPCTKNALFPPSLTLSPWLQPHSHPASPRAQKRRARGCARASTPRISLLASLSPRFTYRCLFGALTSSISGSFDPSSHQNATPPRIYASSQNTVCDHFVCASSSAGLLKTF